MSRPCFALSVMLCCMVGPLLIVGRTHAQETGVSPSHDPGECIVCPLAHGPLEVCGGYSDYDYNHYWYDDDSVPRSESASPADPELELADSLVDDQSDNSWESEYEDYYAEFFFGDESGSTDAEDLSSEESASPAPPVDAPSGTESTSATTQYDEVFDSYDEFGWYTDDDASPQDYFDSYDSYEPIDPALAEDSVSDEVSPDQSALDYETYKEEWFSYEVDSVEDAERIIPEIDEAYDALSETAIDEAADAQFAAESWGDEEEWYREEYGYGQEPDEGVANAFAVDDPAEAVGTGYDQAYDEAMAAELEDTVEPVTDVDPAEANSALPDVDDYESFYDDLYDLEPTSDELLESKPSEAEASLPLDKGAQQTSSPQPAWLTELVNRMLAPIWTTVDDVASNDLLPTLSNSEFYVDECAQEWDCELDHWAQPDQERASVVLDAAEALDGMASFFESAAVILRGFATTEIAETAQRADGDMAY
ncbi:MAG: hypothetical protein H8E66_29030 [Planctomycetes bacterium]|nr:hypothetical protein [Planctomycetota bacterium]